MSRSAEAEPELGNYVVILKIAGEKDGDAPTNDKAVKETKKYNKENLFKIGMSCHLTFIKATRERTDQDVSAEVTAQERRSWLAPAGHGGVRSQAPPPALESRDKVMQFSKLALNSGFLGGGTAAEATEG
ncbi:hypothetical protein HOY80DRAFT_1053315 [Tuber brumale]|nr:hypothetical protein HOY80DRAFT_1053315 [Tuber brumale]